MSVVLALPILVPLAAATLSLAAWRSPAAQRVIGVAGTFVHLAAAIALFVVVWERGPLALQVGDWPAPLGIVLVADTLAALMVVVAALMGAAVAVYSLVDIDADRVSHGFYPLYHLLLAGVCGAFTTGDLFNLFVWFEVLLMASFVLLALGGGRAQMAGALKYVSLNLIGSALFLSAVGVIYAVAHTLNMADLSVRLEAVAAQRPGLVLALAALLGVAFGIKAGLFPLFAWLPASYHTPPTAVSALFAGLLTKVGVYALLRTFTVVFPPLPEIYAVVLIAATATMVIGVIGAVAQSDVRRILSFHILSQIGYIVIGLGLLVSPDPHVRTLAVAATIFYTLHHIVVKTNLFLVAGAIRRWGGSASLSRVGGLAAKAPLWAGLFLIPALSLAGVPPLSGFWAKLAILVASVEARLWWVVAAALVAGLLTLVSMVKIWNGAFWRPRPEGVAEPTPPTRRQAFALAAPAVCLAAITLAIGLAPQPLFAAAERAASELLEPGSYQRVHGLVADAIALGGGQR